MTKEEKIKEEYGIYWEVLKSHIDENGWDTDLKLYEIDTEKFDFKVKGHGIYITRPISLKGIEHNNSWIKIESIEDLPNNTELHYHGVMNGKYVCFKLQSPLNLEGLMKDFTEDKMTHYQPIIIPELPIF